jgi:2-dehydropantoate 2-reductase
LIVGIGALGGTIATLALAAGMPVWLATRNAESASALRSSGLNVSGVGGGLAIGSLQVRAVEEYRKCKKFDLVVLATKAHAALDIAPFLATLLAPGGTLLPIQNGSVAEIIANQLGAGTVVGGLSNLGTTMIAPRNL